MRYQLLATDYDGTLAHDGVVDEATIAALRRVRASGRKLVMVTGRELSDLFSVFARSDLFERIVAENGAMLYRPATKEYHVLAAPPPPRLVDELKRRGVPLAVGRSIVATVTPHEHAVLAAIRDLGLEWHVIFNKGSVMALPASVTKATGLAEALKELQIPVEAAVGVGDAENDHAFLRMCGISIAVANALPSVKAAADKVMLGDHGKGVTELIDSYLLANDMAGVGIRPDQHEVPTARAPHAP
jgi:hydroxymethylpyrimidine pyrophosphatase-like HAD family hydrolase